MNRDVCGFSLSFFIHGLILGACFYLLPTLDLQPKPLIIDFSLIPHSSFVKSNSAPPEQKQKTPPILQAPPISQQLTLPEPIKKVLPKVIPEPKPVVKKLSRPAEKILPKKEEKLVKEESIPEKVETVVQSAPVALPPVSTKESYVPPAPVISRQEMESHYVKAHFVYIKKIIEENISYPPMARRMGWQGKVVVSFVVCRDGKVEDLHIVESSGHSQLDRNAIETVRKAEPLPSPPVRVKLVLPVSYRIG